LKEGIEKVNMSVPVMIIPDENEALDYIYENPRQGALYTIMCDVVAGALEKLRQLKERDELQKPKYAGMQH
jgi:cyanophycin synthetase